MRRCLLWLGFLLAAAFLLGGPLSAASDPPGIKWVAARRVSSPDGAVVYDAYCQACHGPTGRGNGPAARQLSVPVPDLSTIADRDGGFNATHVRHHVLDREQHVLMPDWEQILLHNFHKDRGWVDVASLNLVRHLQRLQVVTASR